MKTDKIRKFLLPNIPYLFIGWAILKISTAYRMAAGADFLTKAMGIGQTIGPAFADLAPGLNPVDWLVGIVGAVGFRLLIYMKSKKAKRFRRDEEYGSARWGNEKDIKRRRPIHLHVMVSEEEQALIQERMAKAGIRNMGAYVRKMALNGYVLHVDLSPVRELVSLQRRCANNLNQVAIHANIYGVYPEEIAALQKDYAALWEPLSDLLKKLSAVTAL